MTDEEYEDIRYEAWNRWANWANSKVNKTSAKQDSIDYWIMYVTRERALEEAEKIVDSYEGEYHSDLVNSCVRVIASNIRKLKDKE